MIVVLTPDDQSSARGAADGRFTRGQSRGTRYGYIDHTLEVELDAVGAEIAVAVVTDRRWVDTPDPDYAGDVGDGLQVRHTRHPRGHLLTHPDDPDDHFYFLVTGRFPTFEVVGYLRGDQTKRPEWWRELQRGRPCFCVPQTALVRVAQDRR